MYLGIDPSFRRTGLCLILPHGVQSWAIRTCDTTPHPYLAIFDAAMDILSGIAAFGLVVGIEEYAFGMSKNRGYSWTIEAGGVLKLALESSGFPAPVSVPATAWKKSIFGKATLAPQKNGPGWKQNYLAEMKRVSGHNFATPDEADAWCVAEYLRRLAPENR